MIGLEELEQLTRDIQDSVMAIRAQPVKPVFQRMSRIVREVASITKKSVRLLTDGEGIHAIRRIVHLDLSSLIYLSADGCNIQVKLGPERIVPIRFFSESSESRSLILTPAEKASDVRYLFVVAENNGRQIALSIDEVVGEQLVIVRPMKGYLSSIPNVTGCALLSNGEIGMVLDMARIVA
jgi:chemotaxis protein histidine kinase CheA